MLNLSESLKQVAPLNPQLRVGSRISRTSGLSAIPKDVSRVLPSGMKAELARHGHGISFPDLFGCQMRFIVEGVDHGGYYSYRQCGGIANAIAMAMSRYTQLDIKRKNESWMFLKHVHLTSRLDKRRGKVEHSYGVNFTRKGKRANKKFFIGYDGVITADQVFHAYRTAMLFKWYYLNLGEGFDESVFLNWRRVRVYDGFSLYDGFEK